MNIRTRASRIATACLTTSLTLGLMAVDAAPASAAFPGANGKIAFGSWRDGNGEIYVMNADGSGQTRLTTNAAFDGDPAWSPDGAQIAFYSQRDGNGEIYVMNAGGSGQTRLTTNAAGDSGPAWSPDGAQIAFVSERDGNPEIYVMNADGSGQTRLTTNAAFDAAPAWSPDGAQIAFGSDRDGNREIHVMTADGSGQTRLTTNAVYDVFPAWSPDGAQIAFTSDRDGNNDNNEIYVMNADGSGQTRLTTNAAFDADPDWQPIRSTGTVGAEVTIPTSAACLELSTMAIDFGTLPLGAVGEPASPEVVVTSCSGASETILARGTDASGPGAAWSLTDAAASCADTLGLDAYRLGLDRAGTVVSLSTTNKTLQSLASGASVVETALIDTACPGSSGAGATMTMQIVFVATE